MARLFDDSSNDLLQIDSEVIDAAPLGMAAWFRSDDLTVNQVLVCVCNSADDQDFVTLSIRGAAAGDPVTAQWFMGVAGANADSATGYSANTWHHGAAIHRGEAYRKAYIDGVAGTAETTSISTPTVNRTNIGVLNRPTPTAYFSGRIAEVGVWDLTNWGASDALREAAFDQAVAEMAKGVPASRFPTGLVGHWPLWGDHSPEIDLHPRSNDASDYSLAVTGATKADHAPVALFNLPAAGDVLPTDLTSLLDMTFSYETLGMVKRVIANWTSNSSGNITATTDAAIMGHVVRGVTDPTDGPSDNYDIEITDSDGVTVLSGAALNDLSNRDTTNTEQAYHGLADGASQLAEFPVVASPLTVSVSGAGNQKSGVLYLYVVGDILGA